MHGIVSQLSPLSGTVWPVLWVVATGNCIYPPLFFPVVSLFISLGTVVFLSPAHFHPSLLTPVLSAIPSIPLELHTLYKCVKRLFRALSPLLFSVHVILGSFELEKKVLLERSLLFCKLNLTLFSAFISCWSPVMFVLAS